MARDVSFLCACAQAMVNELSSEALDRCLEELHLFRSTMEAFEGIRAFFLESFYSKRDLERVIEEGWKGAETETKNLLYLLLRKRHLDQLSELITSVEKVREERGLQMTVDVATAVALTLEETRSLTLALEKKIGMLVRLRFSVQPSLIGGLTATTHTWRFDGSLRGRIQRLKEHLTQAYS